MKPAWLPLLAGILLASSGSAQPFLEQTNVFVAGQDSVVEYRVPVLAVTNRGTLLACCDARVNKPGDPPNYIRLVMKRSTDQGRTWSPLRTLVDPGIGAVADSCALVDKQTGTIWVFSDYCPEGVGSEDAQPGLTGFTFFFKAIRSDDDGLSWSKPIDLTRQLKRPEWRASSFGPGAGIQLRSGRLVLSRYIMDFSNPKDLRSSSCASYSDDHGATWHTGAFVSPPDGTGECQVVQLADDSLLLNMRGNTGNRRRIAHSRDGGQTWSVMREDPTLIEPRCNAGMVSFPDPQGGHGDRILFSNPAAVTRRNLTVRLSDDGGRTWALSRVLYPGPAAYSCLRVLPDGTAVCLYEKGEKIPYERIVLARFNRDWLAQKTD